VWTMAIRGGSMKKIIDDIKFLASQSKAEWFNWYVLKPFTLLLCLTVLVII